MHYPKQLSEDHLNVLIERKNAFVSVTCSGKIFDLAASEINYDSTSHLIKRTDKYSSNKRI